MEIVKMSENQMLRIKNVADLTTLSKSCINLWVTQGKFPPPIELSATVKVWKIKDIVDWIDQQSGNVSTF
jgi:predicted DNA-binding transcriptional regulator AlpA